MRLYADVSRPVEVRCHPHKLLASRSCQHSALLGLVDDVDCAVVEAEAPGGSSPANLSHLSSIPALTYVAEGDTFPSNTALRALQGECGHVGKHFTALHFEFCDAYVTPCTGIKGGAVFSTVIGPNVE